MEQRGIRDQIVISTKVCRLTPMTSERGTHTTTVPQYTTNFKRQEGPEFGQKTQYSGNNMKSLHVSVEASLKKLRTDYIDILYVHWWDYACSVEEVMNGLHHLVAQGKVLYLVSPAALSVVSVPTLNLMTTRRVSRTRPPGSSHAQTPTPD